jgi:hypothetical protein
MTQQAIGLVCLSEEIAALDHFLDVTGISKDFSQTHAYKDIAMSQLQQSISCKEDHATAERREK